MKRVDTIFKRLPRAVLSEARFVVYNANFQQKVGLGFGVIFLLMFLSLSLLSPSFLFTRTTQAATISIAGTSNATAGNTIKVAVNGTVDANTTTVGATWTINNVTAATGDVITVWIDTATTAEQSTAVTKYNGTNITGMVLNKHFLAIGSNQNQNITVTNLGQYDYDNNNNIMHSANSSVLNVDANNTYTDEYLNILASNTLTIGTTETLNTHDLGTAASSNLTATGNAAINISGSYTNGGTFTGGTSTMTFTSTSTGETINGALSGSNRPYNLVFNGVGGGWTPTATLAVGNQFTLTNGTFTAPASPSTLNIVNNFSKTGGTFTHNSSTVIFNGVSPATQTIDTGGATFYNVSKSSTSTLQLSNNSMTIANDLTTSSGIFDCVSPSYTLTVSHNANMNSGGTLNNCTMAVSNTATLNSGATIGSATITAYGLYTNGATFNGTTSLTHNGASQDSWSSGGNTFNGATTITNTTGAGYFVPNGGLTDTYNSDASFVNNSNVNVIYVTHGATGIGIFKGNVTSSGTGLYNWLTWYTYGTATFSGTGTQQLSGNWASIYNLSHNAAGTLQLVSNNIAVLGTFTNSAGTFDANGLTNTVTGLTTVSGGGYQAKAGTQTLNGALTISGGTFTCAGGAVNVAGNLTISSGTLTGSSSIITVSGNWDSSGGTFTYNTSTVIMTGAGKSMATTSSKYGWDQCFYNLTIGANGQTATDTITVNSATVSVNGFMVGNALTIWTTLSVSGSPYNTLFLGNAGALTINSSGTLTGTGQFWRAMQNTSTPITNNHTISVSTFTYATEVATTTVQITATTYGGSLLIRENGASATVVLGTGSGQTLTTGNFAIQTFNNTRTTTVDNTVNNVNVTCANLTIGTSGQTAQYAVLKAGSGTVTTSGSVTVYASDVSGINEIQAGSSTWNVAGNWANSDTFTAGTSTVIFNKSSSTQTLNSGGSSFYNLTHSGAGTLQLDTNALTVTNNNTNSTGILYLSGNSLTTTGATSSNDATIKVIGTESVTGAQDSDSGTWLYVGDGDSVADTYNMRNFTVYNITISSTDASDIFRNATVDRTMNGALTITSGTYNANGYATTVAGLTTVSGGTYTASTNTQNLNGSLTVSGGTFTCAGGAVNVTGDLTVSSGTLTGSSSTITVSGNWNSSGGTFNYDTSTVVMTGIAIAGVPKTIVTTASGTFSTTRFYSLTIGANGQSPQASIKAQTASPVNGFRIANALNIWGTFTISGSPYNQIFINSSATLTINSGGILDGSGELWRSTIDSSPVITNNGIISADFTYASAAGTTIAQIAATTYGNLNIKESISQNSVFVIGTGSGQTLTANGTITIFTASNGITTTLDNTTNNSNIVCGALTIGNANTNRYAIFKAGSGTITVNGAVTINASDASGTNEIQAGSSNWGVTGNWANSDTFTAGTSTTTFNGTGAQTITGTNTWNNLTINNTYASPDDTYDVDPSAAQTVSGTLTVTDGQWTPNTGDSYVNVSIGTNGIMKPDTSASISVSGDWANSGTFTYNSDTVNFTKDSGTQTLNTGGLLTGKQFYNFTHSGAGTLQLITNGLRGYGAFTNSAGIFNANTKGVTVTGGGTTINGGEYQASTATQTFNVLTISGGTYTGSTGGLSITGFALTSGTFTAPSGTFNDQGSWIASGGTFNPGTNTVNFNSATGTRTLNHTVATGFYNITHSATGTLQLSNNLIVDGTFINSASNYDTNGYTTTVAGLTTVSGGEYQAKTNTQNLNGGLTISGGTFTGSSGTVNTTNITISSGTLTAPSTNLNVSGNWSNSDTFTHNSGTVTFGSGGTSMITGSATAPNFATIFNNFTATAGKTLNFTNGKYFKVVGAFNLSGTSGSHVVVNSSDNTNQWYVDYQPGSKSISYADISNSGCDTTNNPITANLEVDNTNSNVTNNGYCWFNPYLSFSMDSNTITFDNLNNANNWTNTKTSTFTTSTNAKNGYVIQGSITDLLTSLAYPAQTISDFMGTWATPALWDNTCVVGGASYCGFGYTSNDTSVQGSNRFLNGTKYASYSHSSPGDILADHGAITSEVVNEQFIITHKASVPTSQAASTYQTTLTVIVTANY